MNLSNIFRFTKRKSRLTIVTGADTSHAKSLCQFVESVGRYEAQSELVIYDLGLTREARSGVQAAAPQARIERFDYENYPDWFDIRKQAGQYAWKPVILSSFIGRADGPVVWMDAGNLLNKPLNRLYRAILHDGFFTTRTAHDLARWTDAATLRYFSKDKVWAKGRANVNGACVGFDAWDPEASALIRRWAVLAQNGDVIAPEGSDRSNHRQDQAVLGVLVHLSEGRFCKFASRKNRQFGFEIHRDID
ncbi:DUF1647 domain-containing protein [Martelella alba]|uniref:DUF1647 domain-containing protein n=1 Tax=Martelella alba TaxID=2590451 RepID=A0A506UCZ0_9HYPH|nr:DUF1647 domain-containing protein [Martelella alba]TPW30991.1 DUF1647 domain-containing protein [Martelella alba]